MKRFLLAYMLLLAAVAAASAQSNTSMNMTLFDSLNPVRTDSLGPNSALWGYVAPDGREYALVGTQIGTSIIDVTEKPIHQVAFIPGPKSIWREMKVYKNYAYIITESADPGKGLQIVDLSALPASATLVRTDSTVFNRAHTVFINGHRLYAMGTQAEAGANGGAIIFDLEPDPLHPQRIGQVSPYYYHDAFERNDTLLGAAIYGQGCDIYDIHDLANPKHLATIQYPYSGTHNAEITSDGGYVVTSDEIGNTPKTMKVWDIHDLNNITKVAEYTPNPVDIVHNVHVRGRYIIAAWYTAGVRIIDMIDPVHPREVGFYDTYPGPSDGYNGVWEAYGFFPSGKVIAGDRQTGLYVLEFNKTTAGSISGVVRNRATGDPLPNATIAIPETGETITAGPAGEYYVGGPNGAARTLQVKRFGYGDTTEALTLNGDEKRDIQLDPLQFISATVTAHDRQGGEIRDFAYAVEPYVHSATAPGAAGTLSLPHDSLYTLVIAKWGYGTERVPVRLTQNNQQVDVVLRRHYQDDATLDLGWSYADPGDNASTGRWVRMIPYLAFPGSDWIFPKSEPTNGPDGYVFQTGAPFHDAPAQESDVNGGVTTLTSPPMDLRGYPHPILDFDYWSVYYKSDSVRDTFLVQVSNDNGASWKTAFKDVEGRAGWKHWVFGFADVVPITDSMRVRFRTSDILSKAYVMAGMDNFEVNGGGELGVPAAPGDGGGSCSLAFAPNPVRSTGTVTVRMEQALRSIHLTLVDVLGREVETLHDGPLDAGEHRYNIGGALPAGSYFVRAIGSDGRDATLGFVVAR
ncbi:MAG: choice-of-anchor B family protein [Bacteroidetes bacterium]|nr:choice-of-anchor B family protein [Bacteroidota bacterium]